MDEVSTFGYLLQHVAFMLSRQSDQVLQERLGIGMAQYRLLMMLQHSPGAQQRALGEYLGQTEASISRQIKLMHQKGMLVTKINPKNRREHLTVLTRKGMAIADAAQDILVKYHSPLFGQLSAKQQQQLIGSLTVLHGHTCLPGKPYACDHPFDI